MLGWKGLGGGSRMYVNYGCQFNVFEIIKLVNPTWTLNFEVWEILSGLSEGSPLTLVGEDQGKDTSLLWSNVDQQYLAPYFRQSPHPWEERITYTNAPWKSIEQTQALQREGDPTLDSSNLTLINWSSFPYVCLHISLCSASQHGKLAHAWSQYRNSRCNNLLSPT